MFYQLIVICLSWYLHLKQVSCGSDIYHSHLESFSQSRIIWKPNQLSKHLKGLRKNIFACLFSVRNTKESLSDWFRPKYKCKVSSYVDKLIRKCHYKGYPNIRFDPPLFNFRFFYYIFYRVRIILFYIAYFDFFYPRMNKP